jgi:hypothetical protein
VQPQTLYRLREKQGEFLHEPVSVFPIGRVSSPAGAEKTTIQANLCGCEDLDGCDYDLDYDAENQVFFCPSCRAGYMLAEAESAGFMAELLA